MNVINYVKASKTQRLNWFGHINKMSETDILKKMYKWKPFAGRPVEREDDVRNDLKKMKLKKGQNNSKIALNERTLLRRPRLPQL